MSKIVSLLFVLICLGSGGCRESVNYWEKADQIVNALKDPVIPERQYNIVDFGAVGDGITMNTGAINEAIGKCNLDGGGRVLVPEGDFLTGPVVMKSNVDLHISEKAILRFSTVTTDYLPLVRTRWEGDDCYNYSPLIYANGQENFSLTGKGTLDAQGSKEAWWPWKGSKSKGWVEGTPSQLDPGCRPLLKKYNDSRVPVEERQMGEGFYLRPQFVNFIFCKK